MLIVTRDHAIDQKLLEQLIARDELGYLGMIGSRGKVGRFKQAARGARPDRRRSRAGAVASPARADRPRPRRGDARGDRDRDRGGARRVAPARRDACGRLDVSQGGGVRLGVVILAAGAGARLGGVAKALLRVGDETYLARIARIARAVGRPRCGRRRRAAVRTTVANARSAARPRRRRQRASGARDGELGRARVRRDQVLRHRRGVAVAGRSRDGPRRDPPAADGRARRSRCRATAARRSRGTSAADRQVAVAPARGVWLGARRRAQRARAPRT